MSLSTSPNSPESTSHYPVPRQSIGSGDFVAELSRSQIIDTLHRREAILHAASFAATKFLDGDWRQHIDLALKNIGVAADVSRVHVFRSKQECFPPIGELRWIHTQIHEWCAPDVEPLALNPHYRLELEARGYSRWIEILSQGDIISGNVSNFPESEQKILATQDVKSIVSVPIVVNGLWWGSLECDECREEREWDDPELDAMRLCAELIGAAIARQKTDELLRESEREMRAVFSAMRDVIFVLDREGVYKKIISYDNDLLFLPNDELVSLKIVDVMGEELGRPLLDAIHSVLDTGKLHRLEYELPIGGISKRFLASISPLNIDQVLWVARDISEVHQTRESLRESEALFRLLAENSTDSISIVRPDGSFAYLSPMTSRLTGFSDEELQKSNIFELIHPEDWPRIEPKFQRLLNGPNVSESGVYRHIHKNGNYVWLEVTVRSILNSKSGLEFHVIARDVTERIQAENALKEAEEKYRSIFENAVEGIFRTTPEGRYLDANPALAKIYGYDTTEEMQNALVNISRQLYVDPRRREDFVVEMKKHDRVSNFEAEIKRKDGTVIWISENARIVRDAIGELLYYEGTVEDITARKTAEERLIFDALHDRLTGLANRALFTDRLAQAFGRLKRHPDELFATLFLDFDRFKNVNDSMGHQAGDQLLIAIAERLKDCLRPGDTVSRLGGDEFAILLEDVKEIGDATVIAERIQESISSPFTIMGQQVFSSASIGIALANDGYERPEDLLRDADMAMYRAKALGKARHEVFDAGMHTTAVALLQLETDLRWAIDRKEFRLHYQPIVALENGKITGFEALIRWQHPERGLVPPGDFIPIAEETGWIVPMGRWVLEEAIGQLSRWQQITKANPPLTMSVNLSSKQFSEADLIPHIEELMQRNRIAEGCLKLEITESTIMENAHSVTERLVKLRGFGVRLGLDDFGTGYSSLAYLHRFPLDTLKIDRSFTARISQGGENREIVRTIITLGQNLGMDIVAEGVENDEQLGDLRALDCSQGQGYFFAKPLAADEALKLLIENPSW